MKTPVLPKASASKDCRLIVLNSMPGTYLLQLKDASGKVYAYKFVSGKS